MASIVFTDAKVVINSVNLSAWVRKVTFNLTAEEKDDTAMGDTWRSLVGGGLKSGFVTMEFNSDFAAGAVDATIWPLFGLTTTVTVNPTSSANSTTNPAYTGSAFVNAYQPVDGQVGDLGIVSVNWPTTGTLTRVTT